MPILRFVVAANGTTSAAPSSATFTSTLEPVTTTALDGSMTPAGHWPLVKYDPFVCDYMGENNCWQPRFPEDDGTGPAYSHDGNWPGRRLSFGPNGSSSRTSTSMTLSTPVSRRHSEPRCNTVYSNNVTFLRWTVWNDDDSITMKQNSRIYIANCSFYEGESLAIGSIGQYPGQIEIIENITARDIKLFNPRYGARIKTWTGTAKGNPLHGGGGGFGHVKNITFTGFEFHTTTLPWTINQCTSYNGQEGGCNTSALQIQDVNWSDSWGTIVNPLITTAQCSGLAPCQNFTFSNNTFTLATNGTVANQSQCENLQGAYGFECTGGCNGKCPS